MPLTVTTKPSKTVFKFPNEPGLQTLFDAEQLRASTNRRFWDGFITLAICVAYLVIGSLIGLDSESILRIVLFFLGGSTVARLLDRMHAQKIHADTRAIWVDLVKDDPSWAPPEQDEP